MGIKLKNIKKTIRLNVNSFVSYVLGYDVLNDIEYRELVENRKLPEKSLHLIEKAFVLGRIKSLLLSNKYNTLSYEDLINEANSLTLTPAEEFALEHLKNKALNNMKSLTDNVTNVVLKDFQKADTETLSKPEVVKNELLLGIERRRSYREVADSISSKLGDKFSNDWELISRTELHAAKTQGIVQTIVNKVGAYSNSAGSDSFVSVIPDRHACLDCKKLYLKEDGSPKVFKLSDLISSGSNATRKHTKRQSVHVHWVATLPPLHPRCQCLVQYMPPGTAWSGQKIVVVDSVLYEAGKPFKKAIGDSALSATAKPTGPPGSKKEPNNPSIQGAPSAAQGAAQAASKTVTADPAQAKTTPASGASESGGAKEQMVPCPFGGGSECIKYGGNGAENHKAGGGIMQAHQKAMAQGASPDEKLSKEDVKQKVEEAKAWGTSKKPHSVQLDHLTNGNIVHAKALGEETEAGVSESFVATIDGNGRVCMKPAMNRMEKFKGMGEIVGDGIGTTIYGQEHKAEAGAYGLATVFGMQDTVPPTVTRSVYGNSHSMQSWQEGHKPGNQAFLDNASKMIDQGKMASSELTSSNKTKNLLDMVPEHAKPALEAKLQDSVALDIIMNNNDRHLDNYVFNEDLTDFQGIDHGFAFGTGMHGMKNQVHRDFHRMRKPVKVSDDMLDRIDKTTFHDMKRGLEGSVEEWQVGQAYLRSKYVAHLQRTEGQLDYEKFRTSWVSSEQHDVLPHGHGRGVANGAWGDLAGPGTLEERGSQIVREFATRMKKEQLPNQLFESWAKNYIEEVKAQKDHPDYASVTAIDEIGVFMPPEGLQDHISYRAQGKHKEYEKTIQAKAHLPKKIGQKTPIAVKSPTDDVATTKPTKSGSAKSSTDDVATAKPGKRGSTEDEVATAAPKRAVNKSLYVRE